MSKKATVRRRVTSLHALHRYTYMHYVKINAAISSPHSSMSIIIDGMAQQHSELPYLANLKTFPSQLPRTRSAVCSTVYRTFGNVEENANLAIHCILMQLEDRIQRLGTLPPTINIQIFTNNRHGRQGHRPDTTLSSWWSYPLSWPEREGSSGSSATNTEKERFSNALFPPAAPSCASSTWGS